MKKIDGLPVPVDFSHGSLRAIDFALSIAELENEIYLLYVVDAVFLSRLSEEGFSTYLHHSVDVASRPRCRSVTGSSTGKELLLGFAACWWGSGVA
jgi:hypothetical protein